MIKGIIFDLDGVLVSTDEFHFVAWKELADRRGLPFDRELNNRLRGVSRMESLDIILSNAGSVFLDDEKADMAEEKNRVYKTLLDGLTPDDIAPEVRETLQNLKQKGYLLAIGSSSKNAKYILERTKLAEDFVAVSDGTNITKSKPDPEVFLKAADMLGLLPTMCAVVEDAEAGILAAKAAGMYAVAINDVFGFAKADISIDAFADLNKIFDKEIVEG